MNNKHHHGMLASLLRFLCVAMVICFGFLSSPLVAQPADSSESDMLTLPEFEDESEYSNTSEGAPVQLQLLTKDELRAMYSDTIPAPDTSKRRTLAKAMASTRTPAYPDIDTDIAANDTLETPTADSEDALASGWSGGSIMFNDADILNLQIELAKYYRKRQQQMYSGEDTSAIRTMPKQMYPLIYVGTIMYFSPKNWAVWINGQKFASGKKSPLTGISVKEISRNQVTIRWRSSSGLYDNFESEFITKIAPNLFELRMQSNQLLLTNQLALDEGKKYSDDIAQAIQFAADRSKEKDNEPSLEELNIDPSQPVDRDKVNMNRLIDQYRNVNIGNNSPSPAQ